MSNLSSFLQELPSRRSLTTTQRSEAESLLQSLLPLALAPKNPPGFRLATGELASGATGRVAARAYTILIGRKLYGTGYWRQHEPLHRVAQDLALSIAVGSFTHENPKGLYCCSTCTLSVFPLYCTNAFAWFDCKQLKSNVLDHLVARTHYFSGQYKQRYANWATSFGT